jgi:putative exosortase-associated protein (TIGR04073 family)
MRTSSFACAVLAGISLLAAGCAGPETKLGRGISNVTDILHAGELSRSFEQTSIYSGPDAAATTGVLTGLNRTFLRAGVGVYEIVTFPFPSYDPIVYPEWGVYPDSYRHGIFSDPMVSPDGFLGISGGEVLPIVPGNQFRIFEN